ncbi:MAG: hypothetical protein WBB15_13490, partial [Ornithinimicrobium sp.]
CALLLAGPSLARALAHLLVFLLGEATSSVASTWTFVATQPTCVIYGTLAREPTAHTLSQGRAKS